MEPMSKEIHDALARVASEIGQWGYPDDRMLSFMKEIVDRFQHDRSCSIETATFAMRLGEVLQQEEERVLDETWEIGGEG